jgi:hypothetical protein
MTRTTSPLSFARRNSPATAVVCCLLSVTASLDASFLAGLFDRNVPTLAQAALADLDETPEGEDDLFPGRAPGRAAGRQDRPPTPGAGQLPAAICPPLRLLPLLPCAARAACRAGCEHSWRNGLGAPLLC